MESIIRWFQATLQPFGAPGLFVLAFLDSGVLPMPQVFDIAVMLAIAVEPSHALPYTLAVTLGSTLGTLLVFTAARAGRSRLTGAKAQEKLAWAEELLRRHGGVAIAAAAVLPAPFPFKYVVLAAGFLRQRWGRFTVAVVGGRAIRFGSQAVIAVLYGRTIIDWMQRYSLAMALAFIAVIVLLAFAYHRFSRSLSAPTG